MQVHVHKFTQVIAKVTRVSRVRVRLRVKASVSRWQSELTDKYLNAFGKWPLNGVHACVFVSVMMVNTRKQLTAKAS